MFATAVSPSPTVTSPPPASPPRTRHRGLSYLRAYTQNRLSSANSNPSSPTSPSASRPSRNPLSRSYSSSGTPIQSPSTPRAVEGSQPAGQTVHGINQTAQPNNTSTANQATSSLHHLALENLLTDSAGDTAGETSEMPRSRVPNGTRSSEQTNSSNTQPATTTRAVVASGTSEEIDDDGPPTIRFFPHQELPNGRPSLHFTPIVRTLPTPTSIIKVGRYSEREGVPISNPPAPSDAPVGFKSKVVSRKHCEFSFQNGAWHIKDVASSSGTFLNHVRLSQPNQASRSFAVKDGDVVQLGIDFRGGEEMIFRCVKIRIECNRSWQQRPNKFK